MPHELLEVLPRFLQLQHQHNRLLGPVARLKEVVGLEQSFVFPMRKSLEHRRSVEVPDIRPAHDVQPKRSKNRKVDRRVDLFHEPRRLALPADAAVDRPRSDQTLHDELPGKRQDHGVETHERNILRAFSVHDWTARVFGLLGIGQEDGIMHWIGRREVDGIQRKQNDQDKQRQKPGMFQTSIFEATKRGAVFAAFHIGFLRLLKGTEFLG